MSYKKGDILEGLLWKDLPEGSIIKILDSCTDENMANTLAVVTNFKIKHTGILTNTGVVCIDNGYCVTNLDFSFPCEILRYGPKNI